MASRALLIASDSPDPPREYEPGDALLGASYSIPVCWLSLFAASDMVLWPSTLEPTIAYTAVMGERETCLARSQRRVLDWSTRWPDVFGAIGPAWLEFVDGVEARFVGVWTEAISDMSGDEVWAGALSSYLDGVDDVASPGFRDALAQSSFRIRKVGNGGVEPTTDGPLGVLAAGYSWSRSTPWGEAQRP